MKHLILLLFLSVPYCLSAQIKDYSYKTDFVSEFQKIINLTNGKRLVAARSVHKTLGYEEDSLHIFILDADGNVLNRIVEYANPASMKLNDVIQMPNGDLIFSCGDGGCDYNASSADYIFKTDANLNHIWKRDTHWIDSVQIELPQKIVRAAGGNVIGFSGHIMVKFSAATGEFIEFKRMISFEEPPSNIHLSPLNDQFIGTYFNNLARWEWVDNEFYYPVEVLYISQKFINWKRNAVGKIYAYDQVGGQIYSIGFDLSLTLIPRIMPNLIDYLPVENGIYIYERDGDNNQVYLINYEGEVVQNFDPPNKWLRGSQLSQNSNRLTLAGHDLSGSPCFNCNTDSLGAKNLWVRVYPLQNLALPSAQPDVAVVEILQQSLLDSTFIVPPNLPSQPYYNIEGGNFKIKVQNNGNTAIENLRINTRYNTRQGYWVICETAPEQYRDYTQLNLPPGTSTWVEFGNIFADRQGFIPDVCFWTSGPNDSPDVNHENDKLCASPQFLVSIEESATPQAIKIFPNPSSGQLHVEIKSKYEDNLPWRITDLQGRTVAKGQFNESQVQEVISLDGLAEGLYFFYVGGCILKFCYVIE